MNSLCSRTINVAIVSDFVCPSSNEGLFEEEPFLDKIAENLRLRILIFILNYAPNFLIFGLCFSVQHLMPEGHELLKILINDGLSNVV